MDRELSGPIDAALMARAKVIASTYTLLIQPSSQVGFTGSSVEIPTVFTHGKTEAQCAKTTREALAVAVAVMLEQGDMPPVTVSAERRDQQINIRVTAEEKTLLENISIRRGFRGVSDFLRATGLSETRKAG